QPTTITPQNASTSAASMITPSELSKTPANASTPRRIATPSKTKTIHHPGMSGRLDGRGWYCFSGSGASAGSEISGSGACSPPTGLNHALRGTAGVPRLRLLERYFRMLQGRPSSMATLPSENFTALNGGGTGAVRSRLSTGAGASTPGPGGGASETV